MTLDESGVAPPGGSSSSTPANKWQVVRTRRVNLPIYCATRSPHRTDNDANSRPRLTIMLIFRSSSGPRCLEAGGPPGVWGISLRSGESAARAGSHVRERCSPLAGHLGRCTGCSKHQIVREIASDGGVGSRGRQVPLASCGGRAALRRRPPRIRRQATRCPRKDD